MVVARDTALPYPLPAGLSDDDDTTTTGVTITADVLAAEIRATEPRAARLLEVATEHVERYAPDAPSSLLNESVIRFAGYLNGSDYGGFRQQTVGPKTLEFVVNHAAAFRNSGAAMLLSVYKVRRAGAIG